MFERGSLSLAPPNNLAWPQGVEITLGCLDSISGIFRVILLCTLMAWSALGYWIYYLSKMFVSVPAMGRPGRASGVDALKS